MITETIETERRRMIEQLVKDASCTRLPRDMRIAAALLGLKMLDPAQAGIRYSVTYGKMTVTAQFTPEACRTSYELEKLIERLNASCD